MKEHINTVSFEQAASDQNGYWLSVDSLHNLDNDMFFSPFSKYTCQAGCKICYISEQIDRSAEIIHHYAPEVITSKHEDIWYYWFEKFHRVGYSDDIVFTKSKFPAIYNWIKANAGAFNYIMTDNAILRQHNELMHELKFAGIMDISISDSFLDLNPLLWDNIKKRLEELSDRYHIRQIKFLITRPNPQSRAIGKLMEWVDKKGLIYLVHHDFTDENNLKHEVKDANNVNDWVFCQNGQLYEIKKETLHLFNDRWFFSTQDATSKDSFWIMNNDDCLDMEKLLVKIIEGKQNIYAEMRQELQPTSALAEKFISYFELPSTYKINYQYNFIPKMLIRPEAKIINFLKHEGWLNTEHGLYKPSDCVKSIIEPLKQEK